MKPKIRLVVTDLDNTLLRRDKTVSNYTVEVFRRLQASGVKIVAATARPIRGVYQMIDLTKHLSFDGIIFHNGAVTEMGGQVVFRESISPGLTKILAARFVSELGARIAVEVDDVQYANFDPSAYWPGIVVALMDDFDQLPDIGTDKLIVWADNPEDWPRMESMLPDDLYVVKDEGRDRGLIMRKSATK
jgi:hydroxymethylpyrimidine pyrophosphatase-like HAD family hydrolase